MTEEKHADFFDSNVSKKPYYKEDESEKAIEALFFERETPPAKQEDDSKER